MDNKETLKKLQSYLDAHPDEPLAYAIASTIDLSVATTTSAPPPPSFPEYTLKIEYVDSEDPLFFAAIPNHDDHTVTIYIVPWFTHIQLDQELLATKVLIPDVPRIDISEICSFTQNYGLQVACKHYVPSESDEDNGSEQISDYPYAYVAATPVCLSTDRVKAKLLSGYLYNPCPVNSFVNCDFYAPVEWETLLDQNEIKLDRIYRGRRVPHYRIVTPQEALDLTAKNDEEAFLFFCVTLADKGHEYKEETSAEEPQVHSVLAEMFASV